MNILAEKLMMQTEDTGEVLLVKHHALSKQYLMRNKISTQLFRRVRSNALHTVHTMYEEEGVNCDVSAQYKL